MKYKYLLLFFSLISGIIIYCQTNLSKVSDNTLIDRNFLYKFIYHEPGTVCPLGIFLGKFVIILIILQIFLILNNYYTNKIINIYIICLIIGILLSLLNLRVFVRIIPAFLLQLYIIIFYKNMLVK